MQQAFSKRASPFSRGSFVLPATLNSFADSSYGRQYLLCAWSFRSQHRICISRRISCSAQPFTGSYM